MDESNGGHRQSRCASVPSVVHVVSFQTAQALAHDSGPAIWMGSFEEVTDEN
jgi:hypothetical protein